MFFFNADKYVRINIEKIILSKVVEFLKLSLFKKKSRTTPVRDF